MTDSDLSTRIDAGGPEQKDALMVMLDHHKAQFAINLTRPIGGPMIDPDKFTRLALTTLRTVPKLADCKPSSLLGALMTCAQLGLEPGGPLGQAYLVPYGNEATLIIGYQGFIDLMYRSDRVASVAAHAVYEADHFYFELGTNAHLLHRPALEDRGELIAVYGIAELVSGAKPFDVLSKSAVDKRRDRSKGGGAGPWKTDYEAMARKTAIRQLFKWIPTSIEWTAAVAADGSTFKEIPQSIADVPQVIDITPFEDEPRTLEVDGPVVPE
jgi:recombination protein RecT